MKKLLCGLFALAMLSACGDSSDDITEVPEGIYTAQSSDLVFTANLDGGKCTSLTVENKEGVIGTWTNLRTSGKYPEYTYSLDGFNMRARFYAINRFNAQLSGALVHIEEGPNIGSGTNITVNGIEAEFTKK